ncbi:MAG: SRPBCC family protein [Patulibacter sp.]|nr:SRPBCC family protein [Patulibacter sp.]
MTANAAVSATVAASPADVWHLISEPSRAVSWWPHAERAEDVQGGRFTMVVRSSRGVPVRTDWRVAASRRDVRQRWEQDLAGTPFAAVLRSSAIEIRLEPDGDGCLITVVVERELENRGLVARWLGRRASRRHAGDALARLSRSANASA